MNKQKGPITLSQDGKHVKNMEANVQFVHTHLDQRQKLKVWHLATPIKSMIMSTVKIRIFFITGAAQKPIANSIQSVNT